MPTVFVPGFLDMQVKGENVVLPTTNNVVLSTTNNVVLHFVNNIINNVVNCLLLKLANSEKFLSPRRESKSQLSDLR